MHYHYTRTSCVVHKRRGGSHEDLQERTQHVRYFNSFTTHVASHVITQVALLLLLLSLFALLLVNGMDYNGFRVGNLTGVVSSHRRVNVILKCIPSLTEFYVNV